MKRFETYHLRPGTARLASKSKGATLHTSQDLILSAVTLSYTAGYWRIRWRLFSTCVVYSFDQKCDRYDTDSFTSRTGPGALPGDVAGAGWGAVLSCAGLLEVDSVLPALPTSCRVPCGCARPRAACGRAPECQCGSR